MTVRIDLKKVEEFRKLPPWFEWDFRIRRFRNASFGSPESGWVLLEDLLLRTIDGGISWHFVDLKVTGLLPTSVCADSRDSCWLTFTQVGQNRPTRLPVARIDKSRLSEIMWVGETNGWYLVGSRLVFAGPASGWLIAGESVNAKESGVVFSLTHGGKTWRLRARLPSVPTRVCFTDSNNGWLLVRGHKQARGRAFRVVLEGKSDQELLIGGRCFSILSTTDGGRSWRPATSIERDLFGIVHAKNTIQAFGASGLILRSDDEGLTWNRARSRTRSDIYAMAFNGKGWGLAVGDEGVILFSDDCGGSWTRVRHGLKGMIFHDVHFSDERSGVVIDPEGVYRFSLH